MPRVKLTESQVAKLTGEPPKRKSRAKATEVPTVLASQITAYSRSKGWPDPETERGFHPARQWRFDFAWPSLMVAVEYEGTTGGPGGRHQRRAGFIEDTKKYTEAAVMGWRVIRVTADTVGELWGWLDRIGADRPRPEGRAA